LTIDAQQCVTALVGCLHATSSGIQCTRRPE